MKVIANNDVDVVAACFCETKVHVSKWAAISSPLSKHAHLWHVVCYNRHGDGQQREAAAMGATTRIPTALPTFVVRIDCVTNNALGDVMRSHWFVAEMQ